MSRIQALDEITIQLGTPSLIRWVDAPYGGSAAVVRFRHRGAVINLSASRTFRLIFQISSSQVSREGVEADPSGHVVRAGTVITSFTARPERIRVFGAADTLQLLFSPELAATCGARPADASPLTYRELQASAAQALVASSVHGSDAQLKQAVAALAKSVAQGHKQTQTSAGGLAPGARRAMLDLLNRHLSDGISVPEIADAAHLSLHHFIKVCRQSEGLTPHALLIQKRIEWAIELLLEGRACVDEVAVLIGFASSSHFVSTFHRAVGVTPATLRSAARE